VLALSLSPPWRGWLAWASVLLVAGAAALGGVASASAEPAQPAAATADAAAAERMARITLEQGAEIAQRHACLACHQIDRKRVGPPFREIGRRYGTGSVDAAVVYLADAIRKGGKGRWGAIPMPAQPRVTHNEAIKLAQWVLLLGQDDVR